jgi:predicted O-linked N-acetylglucosamine transferase (SPINDLY family)
LRGLAVESMARRMADDDCDIIVDLTGWTQGTRSTALRFRPAPTQMQWLGYAGTLGARWCDYIVADNVLVGAGEERYYAEKIIRLPHSYQASDDRRLVAEPSPRAAHGLPEDAVVLCSFNQAFKITPDIFDVWMEVLRAVVPSVLWLPENPPGVMAAIRREAGRRGVAPDRLVFAPRVPDIALHLGRLGHADLALDCFPYGSHTTANDALWAGVPLIALAGETYASRCSASILTAAGLGDLVTTSLPAYRDIVLRYATDRSARAALRQRVRDARQSPLFDSRQFTRDLEAAFEIADARRRAGSPPDHIAISR